MTFGPPERRRSSWCLAALVLLVLIQSPVRAGREPATCRRSPTQSGAQSLLSVMDALELYDLGDPEVIKMVATPRAIGSIEEALVKDGSAWIRANGPSETPRRRLVAVTFALEAVRHAMETGEGRAAGSLLQWASAELYREKKPTEGERLWRKSQIAILQGVGALTMVETELNVAKMRFPDEPRWIMTRAWCAELDSTAYPIPYRPAPLDGIVEAPRSVISAYEDALRVPSLRAEAHAHLAYLRLAAGRIDDAIQHAVDAAALTDEPGIRSLAHLIHGWALARAGRDRDALAEFRAAHDSLPNAQSASLWLAHGLFLDGRRADAEALADDALRTGAGEMDPWRLYLRGDFRIWPSLIEQLREAIR
jgi:hypothetical protein